VLLEVRVDVVKTTEETIDEEANEDEITLLEPLDGSGVLVCRDVLISDEMLLVDVALLIERATTVGVLSVDEASETLEEMSVPRDVDKAREEAAELGELLVCMYHESVSINVANTYSVTTPPTAGGCHEVAETVAKVGKLTTNVLSGNTAPDPMTRRVYVPGVS
jgi:hypothetical protein